MDILNKSIILCDMSDEEIEKIRSSFVELIGLSNSEYKAFTLDYSDIIEENKLFETTKKIDMVFVFPKGIFDGTIGLADFLND